MERVKDVVREKGFFVDSGAIPFGVGTPDRREVHRVVKLEDADILMLDLMVVSFVRTCLGQQKHCRMAGQRFANRLSMGINSDEENCRQTQRYA